MRTRISVLLAALLTVSGLVLALPPSPAGAALADEDFRAFSTGTVISANAVTGLGNVRAAVSSNSVDSTGLGSELLDEMGNVIQPAQAGKNAYGRGVGLDATLGPIDAQLAALSEAAAPPPAGVDPLITNSISLDLPPLLTTGLLTSQAQAIYDPNTCAIGQPISYGRGDAASVDLVGAPASPLLSTASPADPTANTVSKSESFSYFIPNPEGTFGLVSETHMIIAPISLISPGLGLPALLTIEVGGELILRSTSTGFPTDASHPNGISYPNDPLVTIKDALGNPVAGTPLPLSALRGVAINVAGVADLSLGEAPRALGGPAGSAPEVAPDGTFASAAIDALGRVTLLDGSLLDLRLEHMEVGTQVPAGGVHCTIPVAKSATPNPAKAGDEITWTISIPSDPAFFATFFACDLIGIKATDVHRVLEGNPNVELISADKGGVVNGDTVTWDNLGNYTRGDPPIVLTIKGRIIGGTGVLEDTVDVSATLGNCDGGVAGQAIVGQGSFDNIGLTGAVTLRGPEVKAGNLAATGGDTRYLLLGGLFLLVALDIRRRLHNRGEVRA